MPKGKPAPKQKVAPEHENMTKANSSLKEYVRAQKPKATKKAK